MSESMERLEELRGKYALIGLMAQILTDSVFCSPQELVA